MTRELCSRVDASGSAVNASGSVEIRVDASGSAVNASGPVGIRVDASGLTLYFRGLVIYASG